MKRCLVVSQRLAVITLERQTAHVEFSQNEKVKNKIIWTLDLIKELPKIPETYLKHLEGTDGLFEIRVQFASDIFRIFCFFDEGRLVVLMNGFQKKTAKTPKEELKRALKLKEEYEKGKS